MSYYDTHIDQTESMTYDIDECSCFVAILVYENHYFSPILVGAIQSNLTSKVYIISIASYQIWTA